MIEGPFEHLSTWCLDLTNECLRRGRQEFSLPPKAFALLRYMVTNPGKLLTSQELEYAVWGNRPPGTDTLLKGLIRDLRKILNDDRHNPQFIKTKYKRGYEYIGNITLLGHGAPYYPSLIKVVGRELELDQLIQQFEYALQGERQVVFITGETGIGKTTLLQAYLEQITSRHNLWLVGAQCVEIFGKREPYLPILTALGKLCHGTNDRQFIECLDKYAPSWLLQMPALLTPSYADELQRRTLGLTRERMLREISEAFTMLSIERGVILYVEDLHWADRSTLDLINYLVHDHQQAQLMVIGTYRQEDAFEQTHPLKKIHQNLCKYERFKELSLQSLTETALGSYIERWYPGLPARLTGLVHRRSDGNPLFMVNILKDLCVQGILAKVDGQWTLETDLEAINLTIPATLQQLIEKKLNQLNAGDRELLEVASIAGTSFLSPALAAGLDIEIETVEERCAALARQEQFLRERGMVTWPDGTPAARYEFIHGLYQELLQQRVTPNRCCRLHRCIGERLEKGYINNTHDVAVELAWHFEEGHDLPKAVRYFEQAVGQALYRHASQEASEHLGKALALLESLPADIERNQQEFRLQMMLGTVLMTTEGYGSIRVNQAYNRAFKLSEEFGEAFQNFQANRGLFGIFFATADLKKAYELGKQLVGIAHNNPDSVFFHEEACQALGSVLFHLGEFELSLKYFEKGIIEHQYDQHHQHISLLGHDPVIICRIYAAVIQWLLGYEKQALIMADQAIDLARKLEHPYSLCLALNCWCLFQQLRLCTEKVHANLPEAIQLAEQYSFTHWRGVAKISQGWLLSQQGQVENGFRCIKEGLSVYQAAGIKIMMPYYSTLLANIHAQMGEIDLGIDKCASILTDISISNDCWCEAEVHRLYGEMLLEKSKFLRAQHKKVTILEAKKSFLRAIKISRLKKAKVWELRAISSIKDL